MNTARHNNGLQRTALCAAAQPERWISTSKDGRVGSNAAVIQIAVAKSPSHKLSRARQEIQRWLVGACVVCRRNEHGAAARKACRLSGETESRNSPTTQAPGGSPRFLPAGATHGKPGQASAVQRFFQRKNELAFSRVTSAVPTAMVRKIE